MKQKDSVLARVAALKAMPTAELRKQWNALFDTPAPLCNRRFLESRLAYPRAEKINQSYVSRVLRLTLLAPATVEAILDGRASAAPTLAMKVFPVEWSHQRPAHRD